jgi:rhodanese-related sulfurtransferase
MKTIHPLELVALIEADKPVEIIDIRPCEEFEKVHIEGARSFPSAQLSAENAGLLANCEMRQTPSGLRTPVNYRWPGKTAA